MKVVGVGVGPGMLTEEAIKIISGAKTVYGSKRALELASQYIRGESRVLSDYSGTGLPEDAVVLSTGDPMLSGLGSIIEGEVVPGISSFQVACARLRLSQVDVVAVTAHGRDQRTSWEKIASALKYSSNVFVLPDPELDIQGLSNDLVERGLEADFVILERLGYTDERIVRGTLSNPPSVESELFCIMISRG